MVALCPRQVGRAAAVDGAASATHAASSAPTRARERGARITEEVMYPWRRRVTHEGQLDDTSLEHASSRGLSAVKRRQLLARRDVSCGRPRIMVLDAAGN